jgi:putative transposase
MSKNEKAKPSKPRAQSAKRPLDQWAYLNGVELDFSRPGTPTDNAFIEAFNARILAECLNASWFLSLAAARDRIEAWRIDYNACRPHTSLGGLTPNEFAARSQPDHNQNGFWL